jgi:hypothetical protein
VALRVDFAQNDAKRRNSKQLEEAAFEPEVAASPFEEDEDEEDAA